MSMVWYCRSRSPYLPSPRRSLSLLPSLPPSLPPAGVAFLSFPPHSHAGSHRRERTAAPRPVWNACKFWNLKPWREYLPGGSPESVSSKTQTRSVFSWRKKNASFLVEPGGIFKLRPPFPSLLRELSLPCFHIRSPSPGEPGGGSPTPGHSLRCCRCAHRDSPVRFTRNPTVKLLIIQAPNFSNIYFDVLFFVNCSYHLVVGPEKKNPGN